MKIRLSKRLFAICANINNVKSIIDIGSDHGYLPRYLLSRNMIEYAIATDLRDGPIKALTKTINKYNIKNIDIIKTDGFTNITKQVEVAVISGMGGILISKILENGINYVRKCNKIIVQANSDLPTVRKFISDNDFTIINEQIIEESNKIYEIITFEKGTSILDQKALMFGPINLINKTDLFIKKWEKELSNINKNLSKIPENNTELIKENQHKKNLIEEVLYES